MTTIAPSTINKTRHDVTLTVTPDCPRAQGICQALRSLSTQSPYEMTAKRAIKAQILIASGFWAHEGGFTHPAYDKKLTLPEALVVARVLLGRDQQVAV